MSVQVAMLPDGRLHLQHGPIDLLVRAWGEGAADGYKRAAAAFPTVLPRLCGELPQLRAPLPSLPPAGPVARAMHAACAPFADQFITPMAAVAGAVADHILAALIGPGVERAFVNNGGDIAFHLAPGTSLRCGLVSDPTTLPHPSPVMTGLDSLGARIDPCVAPHPHPALPHKGGGRRQMAYVSLPPLGRVGVGVEPQSSPAMTAKMLLDGILVLTSDQPSRGLATSGRACKGRGGRSFSLGIADSVTVLARTAAQADAAATIIGNAVDLPGHPAITRVPACTIEPDSDLGERPIIYDVGLLAPQDIDHALDTGAHVADTLMRRDLIHGAVLVLRGRSVVRHDAAMELL